MRLIFIDMHCINFLGKTWSMIKSGSKIATFKHRFIVDYALSHNIEVCNYITGESTEIKRYGRFITRDKWHIGSKIEHQKVMQENFGDKWKKIKIVSKDDIRKDDIVIGYLYKWYQLEVMKSLPCIKIVMFNHFVSINNELNLNNYKINAFINEIDLSDNQFVNKYIRREKIKQIVCPFIFANRFHNKNGNRKNKLLAIGTLSTCKGNSGYKLYREYFGTEWIQLSRKMIFDSADKYKEDIDSFISYIFEDKKEIYDTDSFFVKIYKKMKNRYTPWTQSKYTSFDMVDKFNEYKMFVCPEELVGMPGIGFVEGMACGTAYLGLDTAYYRKLGLIPGKHYISYDGSMKDLLKKIRYYEMHKDELARIAENGELFVRGNFNEKAVAERFFTALQNLY